MIALTKLLSDCQNSVGDVTYNRILQLEWIDIINSVAKEIARETQVWIKRYQATPNTDGTAEIFEVNMDPSLKVHKLIRVVRGTGDVWYPQTECSAQAIANSISGISSFGINDQVIVNGFSIKLASPNDKVDETFTLIFATEFETNEVVVIDYITFNPLTDEFVKWNPNDAPIELPDWMENPMRYGMLTRAYEKLYHRGDDNALSRMQLAEVKYNGGAANNFNGGYLRKAAAYARNFKDNNSKVRIRPLKYLYEGDY